LFRMEGLVRHDRDEDKSKSALVFVLSKPFRIPTEIIVKVIEQVEARTNQNAMQPELPTNQWTGAEVLWVYLFMTGFQKQLGIDPRRRRSFLLPSR